MTEAQDSKLLVEAWQARKTLYEDLFGDFAYSIPKEYMPPLMPAPGFRRSTEVDNKFSPDMTGQRVSILAYAPNEKRPYWMYVTSGLSNPWFQNEPNEVSGFGSELILKSKEDARWAVRLLRRMAYYILSYSGTLSPGVIISMDETTRISKSSKLNNILIWYPDDAPDCWYQLPSGGFGLFMAIGITDDEYQFGESIVEYGPWCIQQVLRQVGEGQITDPNRSSFMKAEGIDEKLESVRQYADSFRLNNSTPLS